MCTSSVNSLFYSEPLFIDGIAYKKKNCLVTSCLHLEKREDLDDCLTDDQWPFVDTQLYSAETK